MSVGSAIAASNARLRRRYHSSGAGNWSSRNKNLRRRHRTDRRSAAGRAPDALSNYEDGDARPVRWSVWLGGIARWPSGIAFGLPTIVAHHHQKVSRQRRLLARLKISGRLKEPTETC